MFFLIKDGARCMLLEDAGTYHIDKQAAVKGGGGAISSGKTVCTGN